MAIRHGTLCYFRGMTLPGWILNGGLLDPVDALGPGFVRGGRLFVSRKHSRGVRFASAVEFVLLARAGVSSPSVLALLARFRGLSVRWVSLSSWLVSCPRGPPAPPLVPGSVVLGCRVFS